MAQKQEEMNIFITKSSGNRAKFDSGMLRDSQEEKPRYDLTYKPMYRRWAELMGRGAINYGERNWEKANSREELNRFMASAERHLQQWLAGETDEDHAAAVFFNVSGAEMVKIKLNADKAIPRSKSTSK